ncbi:MAG: bifunctional lysylphosphatidylglycerol synthetase/lysine--tRNA ligase LysX [Micrococcales bacterium]|nr:bifunctional lysylphosphatidylglycerol synthetase/lysine--tRNA ligase LysX [Micrococcales bacterium]
MSERTVQRQDAAARILTAVYAAGALTALALWVLVRSAHHRAGLVETVFGLLNVPVGRSLLSVVTLVLTTRALLGRKRIGLWAVAAFQLFGVYLGIVAITHLTDVPDPPSWQSRSTFGATLDTVSLVLAVAILVWLWRIRGAFPARLQPGSRTGALLTLAAGALTATGLTVATLFAYDVELPQLATRTVQVLAASSGDSDVAPRGRVGPEWLLEVNGLVLALALVAAVVVFLRSARPLSGWSGERELALRGLLARHGERDSLGYFATRRDKSSVFAPDGRAAVAYRVLAGVSLASGDPVGDPASWGAAIERWQREAREFGWLPAVISASEDGAKAYAAHGLRVIILGDEAILDPARFSLRSTSMADVRHAVAHAQRAGLSTHARRAAEIPADELAAITAAADQWRAGADRGFSMALNREADPADGRAVVVTAHDADGTLAGVLSFVPWGWQGLSLDVMRRSPQAPSGVTELMVSALMAAAEELGVRRVSLNFIMFRSVYADAARVGAGAVTRFGYSVLGVLDRFWQLERLYRSNAKYEPTWVPRFLCYDDRVSLPQVAIAAGAAEGFLPDPTTRHTSGRQLSADELTQVRALAQPPQISAAGLEPRRSDQTRARLARLERVRASARDPYPVGAAEPVAEITGRVTAIRDHGGVVFVDLSDAGATRQVVFDAARLGRPALRELTGLVGTGDLVAVAGDTGASHTGTPSLLATSWRMLAVSLHPIPFGGLTDAGARARNRVADLIVHPVDAQHLHDRARVIGAVRALLGQERYTEVETPVLQTVHGGASARPFRTTINAYGMDLTMRIAPELSLKRLLVAGLGPVYELGRNFRNEGADATHNPEFTSLEVYRPGGDYTTMRLLTERLVRAAARAVHGSETLRVTGPDGELADLDVSGPWGVVPVLEAVSRAVGRPVDLETDMDVLTGLAREHQVPLRDDMGPGAVIEQLYGELVEPATLEPTFYVDFPQETSPLTRPHRSVPGLVERWDLVVGGMELGTAYSELTDPLDQRRRLVEQSLKAAAGDPEAMQVDETFLGDLELGMPPTGGLGIGIDRLVMLVTGTSIREVLSFPFVRPQR